MALIVLLKASKSVKILTWLILTLWSMQVAWLIIMTPSPEPKNSMASFEDPESFTPTLPPKPMTFTPNLALKLPLYMCKDISVRLANSVITNQCYCSHLMEAEAAYSLKVETSVADSEDWHSSMEVVVMLETGRCEIYTSFRRYST